MDGMSAGQAKKAKRGRKYTGAPQASSYALSRRMRDALDPEKVLREAPKPVKTLGDLSQEEIQAIYARHAK